MKLFVNGTGRRSTDDSLNGLQVMGIVETVVDGLVWSKTVGAVFPHYRGPSTIIREPLDYISKSTLTTGRDAYMTLER